MDILYHHHVWKRESALYQPVPKALKKAKKEGKVRHAGITTHRNEPEVIEAAVDSKFYEVVQIAYNHRQRHAPKVRGALSRAGSAGLGVVTMKTFGGGGNSLSKTEARAALKWVLQDPNVHTIIPSITTFDHAYALRREVLDLIAVEQARACPGVTMLENHAVVGLVRAADGRVLGLDAGSGCEALHACGNRPLSDPG